MLSIAWGKQWSWDLTPGTVTSEPAMEYHRQDKAVHAIHYHLLYTVLGSESGGRETILLYAYLLHLLQKKFPLEQHVCIPSMLIYSMCEMHDQQEKCCLNFI